MSSIPAALVLLGEPIEVSTDSGDTWTFARGQFYFASNGTGTELWILPKPTKRKITRSIPRSAANLFRKFAGWHPDNAWRFEIESFKPIPFGSCLSVAYRSNKWTGRSVGYIHTFENKTAISVDDQNHPSVWRMTGAKLMVESRGITG